MDPVIKKLNDISIHKAVKEDEVPHIIAEETIAKREINSSLKLEAQDTLNLQVSKIYSQEFSA